MIFFQLIPYLFLLILVLLIPKVASKRYYTILFFCFFLFAGLRYGVGWDYFNYQNAIHNGGWEIERTEFIPQQLELLAHYLDWPQLFFISTSLLITFFYFYAIKLTSINDVASIFAFLCVPLFFLTSLTTIRFSLAISLVFFSYHLYRQKRWAFFLAFLVIAFFTHRAALLSVLLIPFLSDKVNLGIILNITIFIVCFFVGEFFSFQSSAISILDYVGGFSDYMEEVADSGQSYFMSKNHSGFSRSPFLYAAINICNFAVYDKLTDNRTEKEPMKYITLYNIGCSLMFLFSFEQTLSSRFSQPFLVFFILLFPYYIKRRTVATDMVIVILLFAFVFALTIQGFHADFVGRRNCFLPYELFF